MLYIMAVFIVCYISRQCLYSVIYHGRVFSLLYIMAVLYAVIYHGSVCTLLYIMAVFVVCYISRQCLYEREGERGREREREGERGREREIGRQRETGREREREGGGSLTHYMGLYLSYTDT